jgi:phage-related minor tail protein
VIFLAGDRIKGIVVEIGGDTQGLDKALKGVNAQSSKLQKELNDVQRLLKFDPNNIELVAQRQKLLNDQIENTEKKLKQLRKAESQVQEQFEKGTIGIEQYRAFQRELADTESYLRNTKNAVSDLKDEQEGIKKSTQDLNRLFEVTGTTLDDFADALGTRTVRAIQQGTASSKDLQRAFQLVSRETVGTSADIKEVRQALQRLAEGESSIKSVRKQLQKMGEDASEVKNNVKDIGGELTGLIATAGAGLGIGSIFEKAMDTSDLDTTIEISMDIPEESQQAVKNAIKTVGAYIDDNETALEGVRKQFQLNAGLTDEENTRIIKGAGTIAKAYASIDFTELIQESNEMAKSFGISQKEALGMTKSLLDLGFPPDQLDLISEYGSQLARAGYTAEEIQGIFASGIETKAWNIDVLLDGLKEGRIGLAEMGAGVDKATADILKGTNIQASQVQAWGQAIAQGGDAGKQAMLDVALALSGIQDDVTRNALGVKFYGTLWEENGENITNTLINAGDHLGNLAEGQRQLNEDTAKLDASPQQQLNQALMELWTTLQPLLLEVTNFVTVVAQWIQQNPELTAGIMAFVSVLGILIGVFLVLSPIIMGIIALAGTLGVTVGAIVSPILIAIAIIGSLIAIGVLLWKNWDEIIAWGKKLYKSVSESFSNMWKSVKEYMGNLKNDVERLWNRAMDVFEGIDLYQTGKDVIQGLINGIGSMARKVADKAREVANGIGEKIKSILKLGSPSQLMIEYGQFTGEGLAIGISNSLKEIRKMSEQMARNAIPEIDLDRNQRTTPTTTANAGKNLTVNIHSPKALDVRQATKEFNRTLNKMSLMW